LGDLGDSGRAHRVAQERSERRADPAGAEPAEEDGADETVHVLGAVLIPGDDGGAEAGVPGAGDLEIGDGAPGGGEAPPIRTVAVASPAAIIAHVLAGVEVGSELVMHAVFQEQLDRPQRLLRDVPPQRGRILDLPPQIGYGKLGQCSYTGHGRVPPLTWVALGSGLGYAL